MDLLVYCSTCPCNVVSFRRESHILHIRKNFVESIMQYVALVIFSKSSSFVFLSSNLV